MTPRLNRPNGWAPSGTSHTASTQCDGMRAIVLWARITAVLTIFSAHTITPVRDASAPYSASPYGAAMTTLPWASAATACSIDTSGWIGAIAPIVPGPNGFATSLYTDESSAVARSLPVSERVGRNGRPDAPARSRST